MLERALTLALRGTPGATADASDALKAAVTEFTTMLRDQGRPPEQVLVALKERMRRQPLPERTADAQRDLEVLIERAVRWSISAYYAPR